MDKIDLTKHIWEGWTVQSFINELKPMLHQIMTGNSWMKPFKTKAEVKKWCVENQPHYKRYIPEVVKYFCDKYKIK